MIKTSRKMDKSDTYKGLVVVIFHSFISRTSSKNEISLLLILCKCLIYPFFHLF